MASNQLPESLNWAIMTLKQTPINREILVQTPWSSVVKIQTKIGLFYLKNTPELIGLEADIIQLLSKQFEAPVPTVIAQNSELNCFLMKDAGVSLRSILKNNFDCDLLCKAINQFTALQIKIADHIDDFINIGVPDCRLNQLPVLYKKALSKASFLIQDGLSEVEITELGALLPKITVLCEELAGYSIQETMVQPDFNDNNTLINTKTQAITIIDLGEISISHPFFSILNCLQQIRKHHTLNENDDAYLKIKKTCLKNFLEFETEKNLLAALEIANALWLVYGFLAYDRLAEACGSKKLISFQPGKLHTMLKELILLY
ncbi:MAG: aminoglycoside phosphotransferase family protein [Gammaproteobacteria bacterium]